MAIGQSTPPPEDGTATPSPASSPSAQPVSAGSNGATRGRLARDASLRRLYAVHDACTAARDLPPEAASIRDGAMAHLDAALREHDLFLDAAAHDLRNPLTAIKGQVQLLRRRVQRASPAVAATPGLEDGLATIDAAVARLVALIDEVLGREEIGDGPLPSLARDRVLDRGGDRAREQLREPER